MSEHMLESISNEIAISNGDTAWRQKRVQIDWKKRKSNALWPHGSRVKYSSSGNKNRNFIPNRNIRLWMVISSITLQLIRDF